MGRCYSKLDRRLLGMSCSRLEASAAATAASAVTAGGVGAVLEQVLPSALQSTAPAGVSRVGVDECKEGRECDGSWQGCEERHSAVLRRSLRWNRNRGQDLLVRCLYFRMGEQQVE